jgi:hypothetical protein
VRLGERAEVAVQLCDRTRAVVEPDEALDETRMDARSGGDHIRTLARKRSPLRPK